MSQNKTDGTKAFSAASLGRGLPWDALNKPISPSFQRTPETSNAMVFNDLTWQRNDGLLRGSLVL